jgi:spermidine/putrescine transport system substrate-binding protein
MPIDNPLSPETRKLIKAQLSRRGFIAAAGGLGAAGLLAACGTSKSATSGSSVPVDVSATDKSVIWANWTEEAIWSEHKLQRGH